MKHRVLFPTVGAAVLLAGACSGTSANPTNNPANNPTHSAQQSECVHVVDEQGQKGSACLPLAPKSDRVDLDNPVFTHPTPVDNPLHPNSEVAQAVYGGHVDGKPFRSEVSRLPGTKTIHRDGRTVPALIQQYVAYSDGRIAEVALDWFAQADDGGVWYLGEDVFNYKKGVVVDTNGTWQAGKDKAPAAMIMPAHPKKGDVYRPENVPGVVFEEVTVKNVNQTIDGPYGKIKGALTVTELHMDGSTEDKVFAPGYGEFSTGSGGDLEAVSLAAPTDTKQGPVPSGLAALDKAAHATQDGEVTGADVRAVRAAWTAYRGSDAVPPLLDRQMTRDVDALAKAVEVKDGPKAQTAALRVAENATDLRLRYEPVRAVDLERFGMWARQLGIDADAGAEGAVAGDVTALELTWQRLRDGMPAAQANTLTTDLKQARAAADRKDIDRAGELAAKLAADIARGRY